MSISEEIIVSAQNKYVSLARSLSDRKHRQKSSLYRFEGIKLMCEAYLKKVPLEFLLVKESAFESVFSKANTICSIDADCLDCRVIRVSDIVFDKITEESAPEGVISVARYDREKHLDIEEGECINVDRDEKILLLESVRDPSNVGAIMRAAAAFGVDRIIMGKDCADIYSAKTVRASMGTLFALRVTRVGEVDKAVSQLKESGRRVFAAALDASAQTLGSFEILNGDCVVIGNEGHGLKRETVEVCSGSVYIPMAAGVESLNAATAAAVLLWEFFG